MIINKKREKETQRNALVGFLIIQYGTEQSKRFALHNANYKIKNYHCKKNAHQDEIGMKRSHKNI